jgi:CBS domain-containing protein
MNVNELMSREPRSVRTVDRLDAVARVLWEQDCGVVPVVDAANVVVGVITDRDLCMASYTQGRPLTEIAVGSAMARSVKTCRADDPIGNALATMQQHQVHRLPVVDARGALVGVLSTNDVVRAAHSRPAAVEASSVVRVLAQIGAPRRAAAAKTAAAPAPTTAPSAVAATAAPAGVKSMAAEPVAPAQRPAPADKTKGKAKGKKS